MFQLFLNDYLQMNAGIFDQPFGDWYEAQSALWVNRFITAPLLYGAEAIIPSTELGLQLRGGLQWGALGQDVDYPSMQSDGGLHWRPSGAHRASDPGIDIAKAMTNRHGASARPSRAGR
jgi:hypothetical protein